jgi:hypothetical protein
MSRAYYSTLLYSTLLYSFPILTRTIALLCNLSLAAQGIAWVSGKKNGEIGATFLYGPCF